MISPPPELPARPDPALLRAPRRVETVDHTLFRWYAAVIGILLAAYMFLDRGIAYLHVPGTPLYIGELTLLLGLAGVAVGTGWVRRGVQGDILLGLLAVWMLWGIARAVPNLGKYGFTNVAHDYALCYYGLFAILFVIVSTVVPELPGRLVAGFSRIVPYVIVWELIAFGISKSGIKGPHVTGTALFSHKGGNICVVTAFALVFMWLVPGQRRSATSKLVFSIIGLTTIAVSATQTRGGTGSAVIGIIVALVLMGGRGRGRIIASTLAAVVFVVAVLGATNLTIHTKKRNISIADLVGEAETSLGAFSGGNSQFYGQNTGAGTTRWRENLWKNILHYQVRTGHVVDGVGFGVNLAAIGGLRESAAKTAAGQSELRSAHNSHLDVEARMGMIGLFLWLLIWVAWFRRMFRTRARYKAAGDALNKALVEVCMATITATLINAFFDPTLEGAQVAALTWSIFGFGIILSRYPISVPGFDVPPGTGEAAADTTPALQQ
ncbi:MAG TPA: O-antigen ligase family protein [Acidimicrobiales bacterium]|nr:O-antigen ligase family protein [Acidimicrobiales bacterium]